MATPDPLLIAKTTRLALQFLATDTMRPTVTSAVMELVMDDVSLASPKLRRELIDSHLAALDWTFADAFKSQMPTATFIMDTDPVPKGVLAMEQIVEMVVAQNKKLKEIVNLLPAELVRAWDHGYVCGASDNAADPIDEAYLGISNPYTLEKGDSTP